MFAFYLLGAIVVTFLAQIVYPPLTGWFVLDPATLAIHPWTLITSMFLHGGFIHIFFNGFALFTFGPYLERMIGSKRFLAIYFISGIAGGLAYAATYWLHLVPVSIPALGASGAIFGILGAVAILRPNLPILMWFIPMPMKYAALVWVALSLLETIDVSSGIAGAAHLGGLFVGAAMAYIWLKMGKIEWAEESQYGSYY
ncbi:rhomboid family intramembrane serine protease [Candidatus Micrarchaeota archaeon]|nr:rhomboid family intramembrane serine protease [Candidatus Micrarchaeota archaeon]